MDDELLLYGCQLCYQSRRETATLFSGWGVPRLHVGRTVVVDYVEPRAGEEADAKEASRLCSFDDRVGISTGRQ
jgi:hypothetical protein